jgi:hypothetical protein
MVATASGFVVLREQLPPGMPAGLALILGRLLAGHRPTLASLLDPRHTTAAHAAGARPTRS